VVSTVLVLGVCSIARLAMQRSTTRTAARDVAIASTVPPASTVTVGTRWTSSLRAQRRCPTHHSTVEWTQTRECIPTNARQRGQMEMVSSSISVITEDAAVAVMAVARHRDVLHCLFPPTNDSLAPCLFHIRHPSGKSLFCLRFVIPSRFMSIFLAYQFLTNMNPLHVTIMFRT